MDPQDQEALNNVYDLLIKQKEITEKLITLLKIMLNKEDIEQQQEGQESDSIRDFLKWKLRFYGLPIEEDFINGLMRYVKEGNLDKGKISEQVEKIYNANKKEAKKDLFKYSYGCFSNLAKREQEK